MFTTPRADQCLDVGIDPARLVHEPAHSINDKAERDKITNRTETSSVSREQTVKDVLSLYTDNLPRSGRPRTFAAEVVAEFKALACEPPARTDVR